VGIVAHDLETGAEPITFDHHFDRVRGLSNDTVETLAFVSPSLVTATGRRNGRCRGGHALGFDVVASCHACVVELKLLSAGFAERV
jgi:hypothetical protein